MQVARTSEQQCQGTFEIVHETGLETALATSREAPEQIRETQGTREPVT